MIQPSKSQPARVLVPEILDELDSNDPRALRSRRDLTMINFLMGNFRWIRSQIKHSPDTSILEIGAGDGALAESLAKLTTGEVTAIDLSKPKPPPAGVTWQTGDIFEHLPQLSAGTIVANLFLHHFQGQLLEKLASHCEATGCQTIIISEPLRSHNAHVLGNFLRPLVNDVTWHDMHVSIDAGFVKGEIPELFSDQWQWQETTSMFGGLWSVGRRKP